MPNPTQIYAELMHNIKASLSQQLIQMYTRCDRGQLNRAFERLENFVQGLVIIVDIPHVSAFQVIQSSSICLVRINPV